MDQKHYVRMWEATKVIPTYPAGEPDKNPMFLEKRVYQGSSGKVYPLPFIDKIHDQKEDRAYKVVYLENPYLLIAILPELGGRIQRALDKTNNYDFVYYNEVIKPALVGLTGPWISGGIEFNWPQHHRPSTFMPVEHVLEEHADGSKTVWVGEIDRMYGTKGMAGFTLYPDKAYLEVKGQLYNRTPIPQTFLWWANPAVAVNEYYKSVFPPDVHAVFDHGRRDVSSFPVATGTYYKVDYSAGVDISWYRNIPVPTSYMAYRSDYDFVGGYDYQAQAGILHIANHQVSPGKKQWTWGYGDFGQAWERNLTDSNGPYIELMTGVYTDNQPDFSWLQPYEEKTFTQYFLPYKQVGEVKNASVDALVNLEFDGDRASIAVYTTATFADLHVMLKDDKHVYLDTRVDICPENAFTRQIAVDGRTAPHLYELTVTTPAGRVLVAYTPSQGDLADAPAAAKPAAPPANITTNEELFLTGLHLEQYRHATFDPDPYYLEGLKRDPDDIRINNAYGLLLLRRGLFTESEKYLRRAVQTLTSKNPNPYDGEPYYNLGLCLQFQGRLQEAYAAFYKATWNAAWQSSGYFALAQIACQNQAYAEALEYAHRSIQCNYHSTKVRHLKGALLRRLNRDAEAAELVRETLRIDPLDFGAHFEQKLLVRRQGDDAATHHLSQEFTRVLRAESHNYLELAGDYAAAGLWDEACEVLDTLVQCSADAQAVYPMVYYHLGNYKRRLNDEASARESYRLAAQACPDYCFPNRLSDIDVLEDAMQANPSDAKAPYYLGNLWYDKKQYQRAIDLWETSQRLDPLFATVCRNLALGYFNKMDQPAAAIDMLERAFALNTQDARVLFELDQLKKKLGVPHAERLSFLAQYWQQVASRDDLYLEYATLLNCLERYEEALTLLLQRHFHPWEGGEGKVTGQYVYSRVQLARQGLQDGQFRQVIEYLEQALVYPDNLGEGKLAAATDSHIKYFLGLAYQGLGDGATAAQWFTAASEGASELGETVFYNDQPADMLFYQGLALVQLGDAENAHNWFQRLFDYGNTHVHDEVKIDYFAVSLPDFLVFDDDPKRRNEVHCRYLVGLGYLGMGDKKRAEEELAQALQLDCNHQGVLLHLQMARS